MTKTNESKAIRHPTGRSRRLLIGAGIILMMVIAAPLMIARTSMRDWVINRMIGTPTLSASTQSGAFGWFSPLAVRGLSIEGRKKRFRVDVESVSADRSWPQILLAAPDVGDLSVVRPRVAMRLPLGDPGRRKSRVSPTFRAEIIDAALTVSIDSQDEPLVDFDQIDLVTEVRDTDRGLVFAVEPVKLFSHQVLSPGLCDGLLSMLGPALSEASAMEGEFSLALSKFELPIGAADPLDGFEFEGEFELHQVTLSSQNPTLAGLKKLIADLHKQTSADGTRVIRDSRIAFAFRDRRFHHQGFRFGLPDLAPDLQLESSGSIGLDESLDLTVLIPRLDEEKQRTNGPIRCEIQGTVDDPRISARDASLVVRLPDRIEPLIDVDGVDLSFRLDRSSGRDALVFDPMQILDRKTVDQQIAKSLLRIAEPDLKYSPNLEGIISLNLDVLRVPLRKPDKSWIDDLQLEGDLLIHEATAVNRSLIQQVVVAMLSDLYGKSSGDHVQIAKDANVRFTLREGGLQFDGARFGFPGIDPRLQVTAAGRIGLDESLDIRFQVPRLNEQKDRERGPIECHLTGTLRAPVLSAKDASLVVQLPGRAERLIDVDGIDITSRVERTAGGTFVSFDPMVLLDHATVSRSLAKSLLHLVDPELQYATDLEGEVSVKIDSLRFPIDRVDEHWADQLSARGTIVLHDVSSLAKSPVRRTLVKVLSDLYGKEPTEIVHVAHNDEVHFELSNGRFQFDGLAIGFPDIAPGLVLTAEGSVGLDETLDLRLTIPRLDPEKMAERGPAICVIGGTFERPTFRVHDASLVIRAPGTDEKLMDVDGIEFAMAVERRGEELVLVVAPVQMLENHALGTALSSRLIGLVAPALSQVAEVEGTVSLRLDEMIVPLSGKPGEILRHTSLSGHLELHQVSTTVKTPLLAAMIKVLADQYGKAAPETVHVARGSTVRFELDQGRLGHWDLEFGFPDLSPDLICRSQGSVGLDQSLDLVLDIPAILTEPNSESGTIRFQISGTIDEPLITESQ